MQKGLLLGSENKQGFLTNGCLILWLQQESIRMTDKALRSKHPRQEHLQIQDDGKILCHYPPKNSASPFNEPYQ
jgi:hypothetical protein